MCLPTSPVGSRIVTAPPVDKYKQYSNAGLKGEGGGECGGGAGGVCVGGGSESENSDGGTEGQMVTAREKSKGTKAGSGSFLFLYSSFPPSLFPSLSLSLPLSLAGWPADCPRCFLINTGVKDALHLAD